jgi:hypothetical protein
VPDIKTIRLFFVVSNALGNKLERLSQANVRLGTKTVDAWCQSNKKFLDVADAPDE